MMQLMQLIITSDKILTDKAGICSISDKIAGDNLHGYKLLC